MEGQLKNLALIAFVLVLATVGCSAGAPQASAALPTGTFRAIDNTAGEFFLELKADGNFTITGNAGHEGQPQKSSGTYAVTQDRVVFNGSLCDSGDKASGTYTWAFDGKTLNFKSSDDKCPDRWRVLNFVWTKQ